MLCLACHGERLATLLDSANLLRFYAHLRGRLRPCGSAPMEHDTVLLVRLLRERGVKLFVCGGLTEHQRMILEQDGQELRPWLCGALGDVVEALECDRTEDLTMPGCACVGKPIRKAAPARACRKNRLS